MSAYMIDDQNYFKVRPSEEFRELLELTCFKLNKYNTLQELVRIHYNPLLGHPKRIR